MGHAFKTLCQLWPGCSGNGLELVHVSLAVGGALTVPPGRTGKAQSRDSGVKADVCGA